MTTMTGFDLKTFKIVCALFSDIYYGYPPFAKECEEVTKIIPKENHMDGKGRLERRTVWVKFWPGQGPAGDQWPFCR